MLLIKNGRIVDPVSGFEGVRDILIDGSRIVRIGERLGESGFLRTYIESRKDGEGETGTRPGGGAKALPEQRLQVMDAEGLTVAPGLMDPHVHFRDPGFTDKEDIFTGAAAAKRGGFTCVVCMANTKPAVDSPDVLRAVLEKGRRTRIHVLQDASVTERLEGVKLTDMEALASAGASGFTDDGKPVMDEKLLREAMVRARDLKLPVSLHEEDPLFIRGAGVNRGRVSKLLGYGGAEDAAEYVLTARDCMIALETGARVCIQHISSAKSVEIVRTARKLGADIHAEATPHHFTLTEEAVLKYGTNARMNPPLRTEEDREAICEGLRDGTIDMIATDHAPHTAAEKSRPLPSAPSGIIGLETSLGLGILSLVRPGILNLQELISKMSKAPADFYCREPASVQEGREADLVIFGEEEEWTVTHFLSKAGNSPFLGWKLPGRIHCTICAGEIVYFEKT